MGPSFSGATAEREGYGQVIIEGVQIRNSSGFIWTDVNGTRLKLTGQLCSLIPAVFITLEPWKKGP